MHHREVGANAVQRSPHPHSQLEQQGCSITQGKISGNAHEYHHFWNTRETGAKHYLTIRSMGVLGEISFNDEWAQHTEKIRGVDFEDFPHRQRPSKEIIGSDDRFEKHFEQSEKHEHFTYEGIESVQDDIYLWAEGWITMFGHEGMTNCVLLIVNGHIMSVLLCKWRTLYCCSNKGCK
jgi:hypothetical protein